MGLCLPVRLLDFIEKDRQGGCEGCSGALGGADEAGEGLDGALQIIVQHPTVCTIDFDHGRSPQGWSSFLKCSSAVSLIDRIAHARIDTTAVIFLPWSMLPEPDAT